mmetsp:Transcript_15509/g.30469  ORF Transcript_15509/g.30469 Transcript_15509/m.30469 type:complete len:576 (-) Transcript_15509:308-2035(-)|eukprot:CAMPEP_0175131190 /NCGR_PEP_ID=MMETSP0087-20121206/6406_1 /TAXON_ID=136419 /ORGANISM="Unknown Unknown, Strain D1" /LENGTH=575 /DNA_ID=CAMNT_0016413455 /DNA_START=24 /DNA_END=1751 /DNA_ORIENTATION=+
MAWPGLEAANQKAKLFQDVKKPSQKQAFEVLSQIDGKGNWPTQTRPNVSPDNKPVNGFMLGLVYGLGGQGLKLSKSSVVFPDLTKFMTRYISTSIPDPNFCYSSVQINFNYAAKRHVDGNNLGPSYIQGLGSYTGGQLWTADKGVIDCKGKWKTFDGTKEHGTQPFQGTRISLIPFTHNAYEELTPDLEQKLKSLGFTKASSQRARDAGEIDETDFDTYWAKRKQTALDELAAKSSQGRSHVTIDVSGYACGRGSAWLSFQNGTKTGRMITFPKNSTGFHCVELELQKNGEKCFLKEVETKRFQLYGDTDKATELFCKWVDKMPNGHVVAIAIADTACAKTRPLGPKIYTSLQKLGAPKECTVIGYRNPFAFLGFKGAKKGSAAYYLDIHAQSKTIIRLTGEVRFADPITIVDLKDDRVLLTDTFKQKNIVGKTAGGRPVFGKVLPSPSKKPVSPKTNANQGKAAKRKAASTVEAKSALPASPPAKKLKRKKQEVKVQEESEGSEEQEFEVEKIITSRKAKKGNGLEYLVKWKGYPDSENTWQPEDSLDNALELLTSYLAGVRSKPSAANKAIRK